MRFTVARKLQVWAHEVGRRTEIAEMLLRHPASLYKTRSITTPSNGGNHIAQDLERMSASIHDNYGWKGLTDDTLLVL